MRRWGAVLTLLLALGLRTPARAQVLPQLPAPAGLGASCGLLAACPFIEDLAGHLRFAVALSAPTGTHALGVGGQLAVSLSVVHLFEGGMALSGDYAQRAGRGPIDHFQGPLTLWARASSPPLGPYRDRGLLLAAQVEDAVGRAPFDRAGTLFPQAITGTAMAGYLHPAVRAHAGAGVLFAGTPLEAQAAQLSAGLSVRVPFTRSLHVFAEGVARVPVPGADPAATGAGLYGLVGVRLFDDFGIEGAVAAGRASAGPDAPPWTVTVQGGMSLGRGYKVPPPDPTHPPLLPMLDEWITQRLRRAGGGMPAAQLGAAPPASGWPAEGAYCRLPPKAAPLRLLRSCVAGYHHEEPDEQRIVADTIAAAKKRAEEVAAQVGHAVVYGGTGIACGVAEGLVGVDCPRPPRDGAYHLGKAIGAFSVGAAQGIIGAGGEVLGISLGSSGVGAPAAVAVAAKSTLVMVNGARAMVLGARSLAEAISLAVAQGGGSSSAAPSGASRGTDRPVPNPYGSKGKPDHQATVERLRNQARIEFRDRSRYDIASNRPLPEETGVRRRPDVWVFDQVTGKVVKVYEAVRMTKGGAPVAREQKKVQEYLRAGIPVHQEPVK